MDSSDSDAEPPRKRRSYKSYLDAGQQHSEPPRSTVWNIESAGEKQCSERQQSADETVDQQIDSSLSSNSSGELCQLRNAGGRTTTERGPDPNSSHDSSLNDDTDSQARGRLSDGGVEDYNEGMDSDGDSSGGGSAHDNQSTNNQPCHPLPLSPGRRQTAGQSGRTPNSPCYESSIDDSDSQGRARLSDGGVEDYNEGMDSDGNSSGGGSAHDNQSTNNQPCHPLPLSPDRRQTAGQSGRTPNSPCYESSIDDSDSQGRDRLSDGGVEDYNEGMGSDGNSRGGGSAYDNQSTNNQPCHPLPLSPDRRLTAGQIGPDPNSSPDGSSSDDSDSEHRGNFSDDIEDFSEDMDFDDNSSGEVACNTSSTDNQPQHPPPPLLQNQPQHPPPPPPDCGLIEKLRGEYAQRIEDRVAASRGEVLLNLQEFFRQHPQPLTAQEDLHKLINSMFYKEIVPETTYKLDKLYSTAIKIRYYFYCSKCFFSFGEVPNYKEVRVKTCDVCNTDNIVYDLTKASFFIIIEFIDQLQLLLKDPKIAEALKNPNEFLDNGDSMKDFFDGSVYKKFVESLVFCDNQYFMSFCACTDGTPIFQFSSSCSIWPIFISVNELPPHLRMANILIAGLWFGKSHPKMDLFLEPFSDYIVRLSDPGFSLNVLGNVRLYKGYLLGMCMDSGARGSVQCVHSHMGESSCNWCLHPGEVEGGGSNARKFLQFDLEPAKRTTEQMIRDGRAVLELPGEDNHINGVMGLSPLLRCPKFDIVDGMVLDTLHWASFGIARRMGKLWLGETKKKKKKGNANESEALTPLPQYYVGTNETVAVINSRISKVRPPREVRRHLRDLSVIHDYTAREWENWLLYYSVPLFKNILPERFLKHWTLFVQAFYLLMKADVTRDEIGVANILMKMYVDGVHDLYGRGELSFNMHISNHAADNALRWGNGWSVSMYAFENGNKCLKSKIYAERGIPHQVVRSLQRDSALNVLRACASTAQSEAFRLSMARKEVIKSFYAGSVWCLMPKRFIPSREERWHCQTAGINFESFMQCTRIIFKNICYASDRGRSKTDNSFCCVDGSFVKIRNIIADETSGQVFLFVSKVRCTPYPLPDLPRTVTSVKFSPFLYNVDVVEEGSAIISCETLESTICVFMEVDCRFYKGKFLSVMANTCNVF